MRFLTVLIAMGVAATTSAADGPTKVELTGGPLPDANMVLSASCAKAGEQDRPIVYYGAFGTELLLPGRKLAFTGQTKQQALTIAGQAVVLEPTGEDLAVSMGGRKIEVKSAGLGLAPAVLPLGGKGEYHIAFPRAFRHDGQSTVFCRSGSVRTGVIGGEEIRLYDDDLDGTYTAGADGICVGDPGKVSVFAPVGKLVPTTQAVYQIDRLAPDGSSVEMSRYAGPTGTLKVQVASKDLELRFALAGADGQCAVAMLAGEAPLVLPVGNYRFLYGLLYRPTTKSAAAVLTAGSSLPVAVVAGQQGTVTLGQTLQRDLDAADECLSVTFDVAMEVDLSGVESACDAGDFAKARKLFDEIKAACQNGPNYQATRAWFDGLGQRLELEGTPEAAVWRDVEGRVLALVKKGDVGAAKALLPDAQKAMGAIPAKFAGYRAYHVLKARTEALGRYVDGRQPGLSVTWFDHTLTRKSGSGVVDRVSWVNSPTGADRCQFIGARYEGFLIVPQEGEYELSVESDDGARVYLDGQEVLNHWRSHNLAEKSAKLKLSAGPHPLKIEYYQGLGGAALHVRWTPPGGRKVIVPAWALESARDRTQGQ